MDCDDDWVAWASTRMRMTMHSTGNGVEPGEVAISTSAPALERRVAELTEQVAFLRSDLGEARLAVERWKDAHARLAETLERAEQERDRWLARNKTIDDKLQKIRE